MHLTAGNGHKERSEAVRVGGEVGLKGEEGLAKREREKRREGRRDRERKRKQRQQRPIGAPPQAVVTRWDSGAMADGAGNEVSSSI